MTLSAQTDSLLFSLDSSAVVSFRKTSPVRGDAAGRIEWKTDGMNSLPKILGSSDPVRCATLLPGVQTNSELDSDIHINGCDNAHNGVSVGPVPVYGTAHMFGFFSVFNPSHYDSMTFSPSADGTDRLGGQLRMNLPETLPERFGFDLNVGIMSSQATFRIPVGAGNALFLSGRGAYMNLLYKRWMRLDDAQVLYGFGDANLTWLCRPGAGDRIRLDLYYGRDKASLADWQQSDLSLTWGNKIASVQWAHTAPNGVELEQTLFATRYSSRFNLEMDRTLMRMPSSISTYGYRASVRSGELLSGMDFNFHSCLPQDPSVTGTVADRPAAETRQRAFEIAVHTSWNHALTPYWLLDASVRGHFFYGPDKKAYWGVSPSVAISYDFRRGGKLTASGAFRNQYLFQSGLSNFGFPTEFWFLAGTYGKPQRSLEAVLSYSLNFYGDMFSLSASAYYKQLYNQLEYFGDFFDFLDTSYSLESALLPCRGRNFGLNLMFHKQAGRFTGWVSYAIGRSLRSFDTPQLKGEYPSNHERIHELNVVAAYGIGRWNFGGTFVCASGTPFTAPDSFYIMSGHLMSHYSEHNSSRLRPYLRLDLSVNCSIIRNERQENGINVSLYNAFGRRNDLFYRLRTYSDDSFAYAPVTFFLRFVPSISYYHKF